MALNQISVVGPRAEAQEQKQQKEDWTDKVLKGLQIANGITGIAADYQTIQKHMAERDQLSDQRAGILPQTERANMAEKGFEEVEPGTKGAMQFNFREGDSVISKHVRKAVEAKKTPLQQITTTGADGKPVIQFVPEVEGDSYAAYQVPKDQKQPKDITVQERNGLQTQYDRDPKKRANDLVFASYEEAKNLLQDPSPAADQALVIAYVKAFDPTSVVKESEAETAQAMGSLAERAKAKFAAMAGDGKLTDAQRQDLFKQIATKAKTAANRQTGIDKQFNELAGRRGVDPKDLRFSIIPGFEEPSALPGSTAGQAIAAPGQAPAPVPHPQDKAAVEWANANVLSPDAATASKARAILQANGLGK